MTRYELAARLRGMYENAAPGTQVVKVHLFGIKYAREIRACDASPKDLAQLAGISTAYGTEINKGVRLAEYVDPKPHIAV